VPETFKEDSMIYSIIVGLIAGWLAGQVMKGGGYGVLMDIVLGCSEASSAAGSLARWVFGREAGSWARSSCLSSVRSSSSASPG